MSRLATVGFVLVFLLTVSAFIAALVHGIRDHELINQQWIDEIESRQRKPKLYMPMSDEQKDVTP